jgi:hypothetical protein
MKLLLIPMLLAGAGAGWFGLRTDAAAGDCPQPCDTEDCRVTVECTERDTCLVTCFDANDEVVCQREIPCDEPCDKACDSPCEERASATPAQGCALPCSR